MKKLNKGIKVLLGTAAIVAISVVAQAETRFAVQDANGVDKMVVTDNGNIGIGTTTPNMALTISKTGTTGETSMMFHNRGALPYNQYNSPAFFFMRNNDVSTNSGLPANGDRLGSMSFGSVLNSGAYKYGANISAFTQGTWTTTSFPGFLTFATTGVAGTSPAERVRIDSEGNVGVGTSAPSQKLEVKGGVRLNTTSAKPATCNSSTRGVIWFTQGGASTADTLEVCMKDASGNYAWATIK